MSDPVKIAIRERKSKLKDNLEALRASRVTINEQIDGCQAGIANCEYLLTLENLNPYDIIPELNDESLGTHL